MHDRALLVFSSCCRLYLPAFWSHSTDVVNGEPQHGCAGIPVHISCTERVGMPRNIRAASLRVVRYANYVRLGKYLIFTCKPDLEYVPQGGTENLHLHLVLSCLLYRRMSTKQRLRSGLTPHLFTHSTRNVRVFSDASATCLFLSSYSSAVCVGLER